MTPIDHTVSRRGFTLTLCANCGFCATNPRPDSTHIAPFYESPQYISHTNARTGLLDHLYQTVRRRAIHGKYKLIARYKPQAHVLDIGCGTGEFLSHLKSRGYSTTGVEPGKGPREQAITNHGLDVLPSLDLVPAKEQFQVITLWHVLEHVHDVRDTLQKIHARLAPEGLLLIAVPDRESWDAQYYAANWAAYDVPRHLSHFRRSDLGRLLKEFGFSLRGIRGMWLDAPYVALLSEKHLGAGLLTSLLKAFIVGWISNMAAATSKRPTSSTLYLAEKDGSREASF